MNAIQARKIVTDAFAPLGLPMSSCQDVIRDVADAIQAVRGLPTWFEDAITVRMTAAGMKPSQTAIVLDLIANEVN